jgi:acylphosphatase
MNKRLHVYFSGTVQGVGFRFTAQDIANELGIRGWVKNKSSGQVEVVAEAEEEKLKEFLDRINQYFSRHIQDTRLDWQEAAGEFTDFEIRY